MKMSISHPLLPSKIDVYLRPIPVLYVIPNCYRLLPDTLAEQENQPCWLGKTNIKQSISSDNKFKFNSSL